MRKLTIRRLKSVIGSALKINLYIQDKMSNEVKAHGLTYRKLGEVKNGAESSFDIECCELVLFASVDDTLIKALKSGYGMSIDVSRSVMDKVVIPAGQEDVVISGKNSFNPVKGNPFIFNKDSY